ncbi:uncharacterized protein (DUF58 family) [Mycolicibacterium iranicum]|uniref:Uncharacterized protein (DUF58 family) n=1 Tax=Mycolicibacterium iranicum TaxID=912594 RepID=A0A839QBZ9_MYCIR|nr:hypothetical protein [Mycolicibacterium iranicum]MBB2993113.1 uncharacterized protein (DUF58 family) [Mycolicibacterium iranicum]
MSFETEESWVPERPARRRFGRRAGSPWTVLGFALGVLTISNAYALYYWLFAPLVPTLVAGALVLASVLTRRHSRRLVDMADGALAAALFAVAFAATAFLALALG